MSIRITTRRSYFFDDAFEDCFTMYRTATDKTGQGITELTGQRDRPAKHACIFKSKISELIAGLYTWLNYII